MGSQQTKRDKLQTILDYITEYNRAYHTCPTQAEIAVRLGWQPQSRSAVNGLVRELVEDLS